MCHLDTLRFFPACCTLDAAGILFWRGERQESCFEVVTRLLWPSGWVKVSLFLRHHHYHHDHHLWFSFALAAVVICCLLLSALLHILSFFTFFFSPPPLLLQFVSSSSSSSPPPPPLLLLLLLLDVCLSKLKSIYQAKTLFSS